MGPLFFPGWPSSASPSFPSSSIIFDLFSHHEINFFDIFWLGRIGRVLHSPILLFPYHPKSLLFFGLYEYIYMDRIKKNEIDFPFLSLPPSCLPKPQNLGLPPPLLPRTLVYCLFEVRAEVTDTVFNCT